MIAFKTIIFHCLLILLKLLVGSIKPLTGNTVTNVNSVSTSDSQGEKLGGEELDMAILGH